MQPRLQYSLLFALLGAIFFIPLLGGVHLFDWDEINFAEISREMIITGDYTRIYVNFEPFWEKPPFFFWLQSIAMQLFGINEFSARLPNALFGMATLVMLFLIGYRLNGLRFGILWATVYFGTVLPFLYFKSGIIDPVFNFFIFLGMYFFILFYWKKDGFSLELMRKPLVYLFWAGFFIGMGVLTKGQVAYLIAALTMFVYWAYQRFRFYVNVPQFLFFTLSASLVSLAWYGIETYKNGTWFIEEFNRYQYRLFSTPDAGHAGFPGYHFVVLMVGCFPASIFMLRSLAKFPAEEKDYQRDFRLWMKFLFWTVLILFTIVRSKIVHYSSMCYFPITYLAALTIEKLIKGEVRFGPWMRFGLIAIGGLYVATTLALPLIGQNIEWLRPLFQQDPFALGNLEADVRWTGWEIIPGLVLLGVLIGSIMLMNRRRFTKGVGVLFGGTALFVFLTLIFFIKRIEGYSQRAAIEFFEKLEGKEVYVTTSGYKSYAHLFYSKKTGVEQPKSRDKQWLLTGDIDKPAYFSTKVHRADELRQYEELEEIGQKNGFVFFKRPVPEEKNN